MSYRTQLDMWDIVLPLRGVTDNTVEITGTFRVVTAGEVGDYATDFAVANQHIYFYINSLTGSGDITITGTSINEITGIATASDTETVTVDTAGVYYQSDKKWWEVINIDIPVGISAIDYDIGIIGYADFNNHKFKILGYRADFYTQGVSADLRFIIERVKDNGSKQFEIVTVEDIGFDANSASNQINDHLRTGGNDRSYNPTVGSIIGDNQMLTLKQFDFDSYFSSEENVFLCKDLHEGVIIRLEGEPSGGISNVDWASLQIKFMGLK